VTLAMSAHRWVTPLLLHLLWSLLSFTSASQIWVLDPHMTAASAIRTFTGPLLTSSRAERGRESWTISISELHFCLCLNCILIFCIVMSSEWHRQTSLRRLWPLWCPRGLASSLCSM
jgi:hypothetical protein